MNFTLFGQSFTGTTGTVVFIIAVAVGIAVLAWLGVFGGGQ